MMPARQSQKGKWFYRKTVERPDGRTVRITGTPSVDTKKAAEAAERAHIERVLKPGATVEKMEVPTFKKFQVEFMETYVRANNKPSERIAKGSIFSCRLLPAFEKMRLDEITVRQIEQYKADALDEELAPKTINNHLTVLGKMLKYAQEVGVLEVVPRVKFVKVPPSKFDFLDFDEWERLVEAARAVPEALAAILVAGEAGLRAGEVKGLEWDDFDFVAARLTVQRSDYRGHVTSPKGGRARIVPMTKRLATALKAIRHLRGSVVFCGGDGARWSRGEMDSVLRRVVRRAGLRWMGWHALRHTFCSHLAMRGASPRAIQELAGHASLLTTQRYMHLTPAAAREAIGLLEERRGILVASPAPGAG